MAKYFKWTLTISDGEKFVTKSQTTPIGNFVNSGFVSLFTKPVNDAIAEMIGSGDIMDVLDKGQKLPNPSKTSNSKEPIIKEEKPKKKVK